jgi:hypothetical protein
VAGSVAMGYTSDLRVTSQTVNGANSLAFGYDDDGLPTAPGRSGSSDTDLPWAPQ